MAGRNDLFPNNIDKYEVHGLLCDNEHDVYAVMSLYWDTRFDVQSTGAFNGFENDNATYPNANYIDYVTGPAAKATFGRPSSNVQSTGVIGQDEWGGDIYGTINTEPVSNLDFSASDPCTVAVTSSLTWYTSANHFANLRYSWFYNQMGPISGGSTSKFHSLSYEANAGPVSYSATRNFPLLDTQYYDTYYPPNEDYFFVYVNIEPVNIPNAGSGAKPNTTFNRVRVTSGQFNHTTDQFFS
jgi:hypothetical protein